jgi:hypothetical protein
MGCLVTVHVKDILGKGLPNLYHRHGILAPLDYLSNGCVAVV